MSSKISEILCCLFAEESKQFIDVIVVKETEKERKLSCYLIDNHRAIF